MSLGLENIATISTFIFVASFLNAGLSTDFLFMQLIMPGMIQGMKAGDLGVRGLPWIQSKFKDSLGYIRPWSQKKKQIQEKRNCIGLGLNLVAVILVSLDYNCKEPVSKRGYTLKQWRQ